MFTLYKRKYSNLFAKVALFVFFFAWIACTSHASFVLPVTSTHTQASHSSNEEPQTHNTSCIDHTYQISARNQGNVFSGDLNTISIPEPMVTFDLSFETVALSRGDVYESDQGEGKNLFLKNTVLLL